MGGRQTGLGLTATEVTDTKLGNKLRVMQGSKAMIGGDKVQIFGALKSTATTVCGVVSEKG